MRPEDAHRLVQAMERRHAAMRRLLVGHVDGALAHEYIASIEAEQEAREAALGTSWTAISPRTSSRSPRS